MIFNTDKKREQHSAFRLLSLLSLCAWIFLVCTASRNAETDRSAKQETPSTHLLRLHSGCFGWDIEWIEIQESGDKVELAYRSKVNLQNDFWEKSMNIPWSESMNNKMFIGLTADEECEREPKIQTQIGGKRLTLDRPDWQSVQMEAMTSSYLNTVGQSTVFVRFVGSRVAIQRDVDSWHFGDLKRMILNQEQ